MGEARLSAMELDQPQPYPAAAPKGISTSKIVVIIFSVWTIVGILTVLQVLANLSGNTNLSFRTLALVGIGNSWLKAALSLPVLWCLAAIERKAPLWKARVPLYVVLMVAFLIVHVAIRPLVLPFIVTGGWTQGLVFTYSLKVVSLVRSYALDDLWAFLCTALAFHVWRRSEEARLRALNEERLGSRLARAELQVLKMQLQPHFLFNTLNTIYHLVPQQSSKAQLLITQLSDLLRDSLEHANSLLVPVKEELTFVERYLEIEKARLEERLQIVRDVDPNVLDASVPGMILQPLAENAVRYGVARSAAGGTVGFNLHKRDGRLLISVTNRGPISASKHRGKGIGLANTRARLTRHFGDDFSLSLSEEQDGACVSIDLPFRKYSPEVQPDEELV